MKKIIFVLINMNVGGTEKSLLNILNELNKVKYDITLFMLEEYGGFLESIPNDVKVKYLNDYDSIKEILNKPPISVSKEMIKSGNIIKGFNIIFYHILSKIFDDRSVYFNYILKKYPILDENYDMAVAFAGPMDFITYYVINKIKAKKKIQWVHFDVTKIGFNKKFCDKMYNKFDKVFVVSKEGKDKLVNLVPSLRNKTEVLHNIISPNTIKKMAEEGDTFDDNFEGIRILTVGRLSIEKGQHLTIPVLEKLKKEGYNLKWYCVGDGKIRNEYEDIVRKKGLEEDYIFYGSSSNPYRQMKDCDIYVQPSIHEGFCITLAEARCFNSPIVTTNFTGAKEQIRDGETGLICDATEEDLYKNIKELLDNDNLREKIKNNLKDDYPNTTKEIEKLENIINS